MKDDYQLLIIFFYHFVIEGFKNFDISCSSDKTFRSLYRQINFTVKKPFFIHFSLSMKTVCHPEIYSRE